MVAYYGQTFSTLWGPQCVRTATAILSPADASHDDEDDDTAQKSAAPPVLEVSVHTLPKNLQREFKHVFPEENLEFHNNNYRNEPDCEYLAIPTNQRALMDLVVVGDAVELEKDRLLNVFMTFARGLCDSIRAAGYWADFIDPCSGLPMLTLNCNKVYSEVDGMEVCLNYKSYNAGFCKVLVHPKFGSAVYPATIFARAPRQFIIQLLQQYLVVNDY
jgi:hypothetical protein